MNQMLALIVEDQRDNVVLFRDVLQLANCVVENARDGLAAIEWLKTHEPPQLIILDLNLPYMSGLEVYRYIRQQNKFAATRIVATTANITMADQLKEELIPEDLILHKPVNIMELLELAKTIVSQVPVF